MTGTAIQRHGVETPLLSDGCRRPSAAYFPRYPTRQAVVLPALHVVNQDAWAACRGRRWSKSPRCSELAPAEVQDTLSFYGFFRQDSAAGALPGVGLPLDQLRGPRRRGAVGPSCRRGWEFSPGETTADGRVSLGVRRVPGGLRLRPGDAGQRHALQESDRGEDRPILAAIENGPVRNRSPWHSACPGPDHALRTGTAGEHPQAGQPHAGGLRGRRRLPRAAPRAQGNRARPTCRRWSAPASCAAAAGPAFPPA